MYSQTFNDLEKEKGQIKFKKIIDKSLTHLHYRQTDKNTYRGQMPFGERV